MKEKVRMHVVVYHTAERQGGRGIFSGRGQKQKKARRQRARFSSSLPQIN